MRPDDYASEIKWRDLKIAELEDIVTKLKLASGVNPSLILRFKISWGAAKILEILSTGRLYSTEQLTDMVCKENTLNKSVPARIYHLRRAIAPLEIKNVGHGGYYMEGESLKAIREILAGDENATNSQLGTAHPVRAKDGVVTQKGKFALTQRATRNVLGDRKHG